MSACQLYVPDFVPASLIWRFEDSVLLHRTRDRKRSESDLATLLQRHSVDYIYYIAAKAGFFMLDHDLPDDALRDETNLILFMVEHQEIPKMIEDMKEAYQAELLECRWARS